MGDAPVGWTQILDPGEKILWQGQPDAGIGAKKDTIYFAKDVWKNKGDYYSVPISFEYIDNGLEVLGLIRAIQTLHKHGESVDRPQKSRPGARSGFETGTSKT
ncbi:hypothetical protein [Algirhabdus cladophorae]|uniref:hypothetical protein n=1 Tax=Algirhabdus cladophorae TaxID=3377108 RepID=UPI003B84513A